MRFEYALRPPGLFLQTQTTNPKAIAIHQIYIQYKYVDGIDESEWEENWEKMIHRASALYRNHVCDKAVSPSYAIANIKNETYPENNFIMVVVDDDGTDKGVLQSKIDLDYSKIDVVCAFKGFGAKLIAHYIQYFDHFFPNNYMKLSAMPNVLTFYQRFGFEFRQSIRSPVVRPDFTGYAQVLEAKKLPDVDAAYKYVNVLNVLKYLQAEGINESKAYDGCKANESTNKDIIQNNCANDGYMMYRLPLGRRPDV